MGLNIQSQKKIRKIKAKWHVDSWEDYEKMEEDIARKTIHGKEPSVTAKVRIIAGKAKNYTLSVPRNTRPLTDRLKTTIFDVLGSDIVKKDILDLYAGSGSFGLEALSRGANSVTFVDAGKNAIYVMEGNIKKTGFLTETTLIKQKVEDFLGQKENLENTYHIIFIDPPYKKFNEKNIAEIENVINSSKLMLPGFKKDSKEKFKGAILLKHPRRYPLEKLNLNGIKCLQTYDFGLNAVSIYIVI
jgi:16S rRNA (guanine966-N2)-methyltransferase